MAQTAVATGSPGSVPTVPGATSTDRVSTLNSITGLRFLAAFLVVCVHFIRLPASTNLGMVALSNIMGAGYVYYEASCVTVK